jgi:c-di-GMP-binding flagellar brake protein YcgR
VADEAPKKDSPFEEIRDATVIKDVFSTSYKQGLPIQFWMKDKKITFDTIISGVNKERIFIDLPKSVALAEFDAFFSAQTDPADHLIFGTVMIQKSKFFLKILVAEREERTVKCYLPHAVFKLQRRTALRIKLSFVKKVFCTFDDPKSPGKPLQYRMMDLSTGGTSIQAKPEDEAQFPVGMQIKNIEFKVHAGLVNCNGEVRHTMQARDESRAPITKVGIQFKDLPVAAAAYLQEFEEYESRLLFSSIK